ncbi:MAG TPA: hypothetical protein VM681_02910, partial [Candidatus Thermoplasmatota archaeon]|nr:hypothetical protein [Candidatus Thermoplasmatota archaeon]
MVNKDTLVGLFGAAILLVAMVAIFAYDTSQGDSGTPPPGSGFEVHWPTGRAAGPGGQGNAADGAPGSASLSITQPNMTQVEFSLTWSADRASCN